MVVKWEPTAIQDLKDFKNMSKMVDPNKYIGNFVQYVDILSEQPRLGKIYSYTSGYIIRQLIHEKHKIFYYVDEDVVHIISMVHYRQDVQSKINYLKEYYNYM